MQVVQKGELRHEPLLADAAALELTAGEEAPQTPFSQDFCSELRYRRSEAILLIRMLAYFDGASCGHARATRLVRFQRCWKYRLNEKPS